MSNLTPVIIKKQSLASIAPSKLTTSVHKFGGSSLANAQCIERVLNILAEHVQVHDLVVVSANGNTTDQLFCLLAANTEAEFIEKLHKLHQDQESLAIELLELKPSQPLLKLLSQDIEFIEQCYKKQVLKEQRNNILAFGEVWSARLLAYAVQNRFCPAHAIDARDVFVLNSQQDFQLDEAISQIKLIKAKQLHQLNILTGYIATDEQGNTQTLGRNGSDYSATIAAHLLNVDNVTLWTDVDGIYSADPRIVTTARKLYRLENAVAKELGRLGNPVLHANTLTPLLTHNIHLNVASSFDAQNLGTEIGAFGDIAKSELSITHNNDLIKINSKHFEQRILSHFLAVYQLIYQCPDKTYVVLSQQFAELALLYLDQENIHYTTEKVSLIAVVGYQVGKRGDIKARFKRALKNTGYNTFVGLRNGHSLLAFFDQECSVELINRVHSDVTKDSRNIGLVIVGLGNIGQRFLDMLPNQLTQVDALEHVHLVGLATSQKALINTDGIEPNQALSLFSKQSVSYDNKLLLDWLSHHPYDELVVVDITASEQFSQLYAEFFSQGIHVISANKCAGSSSHEVYQNLRDLQANSGSEWLSNTTVGAGLPINYAITDLSQCGDSVVEISGIFSGTLSWLFANYDGRQAFSELLQDALAQGFTEPDPRDDLSGLDVQRKLLILARLAGFSLELEDIDCQNLVPLAAQSLSTNTFLENADILDHYFAEQLQIAKQQNGCLRYVARFTKTGSGFRAKVALEILANNHAFANLTPCDNIFLLTTKWYQENPLIIRGPGAGRDVTAGGIHSDLVNLCRLIANKKQEVEIKGIN